MPRGHNRNADPGMQNVQVVSEPLKPYEARLMRCYPVINNRQYRFYLWLYVRFRYLLQANVQSV